MHRNVGFLTEDAEMFPSIVWLQMMEAPLLESRLVGALKHTEGSWDYPALATMVAVGSLTGGECGLRGGGFGLGTLMGANGGQAFVVDWSARVVLCIPWRDSEWFQFPEFAFNRELALERAVRFGFAELTGLMDREKGGVDHG
jgi:hypothetical protein